MKCFSHTPGGPVYKHCYNETNTKHYEARHTVLVLQQMRRGPSVQVMIRLSTEGKIDVAATSRAQGAEKTCVCLLRGIHLFLQVFRACNLFRQLVFFEPLNQSRLNYGMSYYNNPFTHTVIIHLITVTLFNFSTVLLLRAYAHVCVAVVRIPDYEHQLTSHNLKNEPKTNHRFDVYQYISIKCLRLVPRSLHNNSSCSFL